MYRAGLEHDSPFSVPGVAERYEDWYATPFGALADRVERAMLEELLAPLRPGASLLDVGCGTGHFAVALGAGGYRVAGADPDRAMLAAAAGRVPAVRADGARLPFADGAFDGAVLVSVLGFVSDPVAVLCEARRVARTRVAVVDLAGLSWLGLWRRLLALRGHPVFARARFHSRARLIAFARAAGAEPELVRSALFLPHPLAGRVPRLEQRMARASLPLGGVVGLALPGAS